MHYLQKHILDTLRFDGSKRYSDLQPEGVESSHFRYHLKQLERDGFVSKIGDGVYDLTPKGVTEVDYLSVRGTNVQRTPKPITYTLLTHGDELFLYRKDKEPYKDKIGLVGGKLHFGEDSKDAAIREVHEKLGWNIESPELKGIATIKVTKNDDIITHVIAYVYAVDLQKLPDELPANVIKCTRSNLQANETMHDLEPLLDAIELAKTPFVLTLNCDL